MLIRSPKTKIITAIPRPVIRLGLWATAFLLLVAIFYLIHLIVINGVSNKYEDVDIYVKLPIFLTPLGILWALLLILFTQMTTALKDGL